MSNGAGLQPKTIPASQPQFDSLLTTLSIPLSLSSSEKLAKLRSLPPSTLITASAQIYHHQFRSCSDGAFINKNLFADIDSGAYAQKLISADVHIILGEVRDEHFVYSAWRPPTEQSLTAVHDRLCAEYPESVVSALLQQVYCPGGKLPTSTWPTCKEWSPDAFGYIYADLQVHALERGFVDKLIQGGAGGLVHRYRVEFRAKCVDSKVPPEWGVTHGTDVTLWFFGNGAGEGLLEREENIAREFCGPVWKFLKGKGDWEGEWGADTKKREVRLLKGDGSVGVWKDKDWERGLRVWEIARGAQMAEEEGKDAKL